MHTEENRLRVRRHELTYRVAKGSSPPQGWRSQHEALESSLGERVSTSLPSGDKSVWLIRRLDVRVAVGTSSTPGGIAKAVATAVTGALVRTLDERDDGTNVMRFPDRATFIGRLLIDCARDRAARRWEYGEFGEIPDLPRSTAIRTLITREPATSFDALLRMPAGDLRVLLSSLSPVDAGAVLESLGRELGSSRADAARGVVEALNHLLGRSELPSEPRATALALFLEVARTTSGRPPIGTDALAREVSQLVSALREASREESRKLAAAIIAGDWRAIEPRTMQTLTDLVSWPKDIRKEAVRSISEALFGNSGSENGNDVMATGLGGMFLMLPLLDEFPWTAAAAALPDWGAADPSRLLKYLTLVAALGSDRNPVAAGDAVLRVAVGLPAKVGADSIYRWAEGVGEGEARRSLQLITEHLHRHGKVSGKVTLAPLNDGVVAVDGARGLWLGTAPGDPVSIRTLVASIDAAIDGPIAVTATEPWIKACIHPERSHPGPIDDRFLIRLEDSAQYATVGFPFDLPPVVRDLIMVTGQALGRELAWRLPGFSASSLPYLWENFLKFAAEISFEPHQIVVRVGNPPLHLVLSLAGLNRSRFLLDATGEREWVLTQQH